MPPAIKGRTCCVPKQCVSSGRDVIVMKQSDTAEPPRARLESPASSVSKEGGGVANSSAGIDLSVVVPTFRERENIRPLLEKLSSALSGLTWEVIFVDDDSGDGTAELVREIAGSDPRVRCIQRIGRRGLSSACIEGMLSSSAKYLAVMDADLQHDESLLPAMHSALVSEDLDIIVGSRYVAGGGIGDWDRTRVWVSSFASRLSRAVIKAELSDPMSGFFMLPRGVFQDIVCRLSGIGFKLLMDIFASSRRPLRFRELPYTFRTRFAGESKLDTLVAWEFVILLLDKLVGHIVPVRFILFASVGGFGLLIHLAVLYVCLHLVGLSFVMSQATATMVAMTTNYAFNNVFTYRDKRLTGMRFSMGLLTFYLVCGFGAVANVGIANFVYGLDKAWWLAGVTGAIVGAVWNYAVTSVFIWTKPKKA